MSAVSNENPGSRLLIIALLVVVIVIGVVSLKGQGLTLELAPGTPAATTYTCSTVAPVHSSEDFLTLPVGQVVSYTTAGGCGSTGARGLILDQLPQGINLVESHLTSAGFCHPVTTVGTWVYVAETGSYTSVGTQTLPPAPGCCDSSNVWSFSSDSPGAYDVIFRGSGYASEGPCGEQLTLHITVVGRLIPLTTTLTARTEQYTATVPVGGSAELRLATNPSTGTSWWIQSQPSGVEITTSSGTDPSITCPVGVGGCSNLLTIYTVKGLVVGEYVVEFRNGHAWAKNEYYIVVLFHLTVLAQTQTQTTATFTVSTVTVTSNQYESCASMSARGGCGICQDEQGRLVSYECPIGSQFPNPPQSLSDVPRFLTQFWAWVSCQYLHRC
jgi:predicted secreted protein